jgi:hypothetical protein
MFCFFAVSFDHFSNEQPFMGFLCHLKKLTKASKLNCLALLNLSKSVINWVKQIKVNYLFDILVKLFSFIRYISCGKLK